MKTISKKTREEAIEVLLCCADSRISGGGDATYTISDGPVEWLGAAAYRAVWKATWEYGVHLVGAYVYLEAAALLRDGWSPGDPVVRRGGGS